MGRSHLGEVSMGSSVDVTDGDDVRSSGKRLENYGGCGAARREGERVASMFEGCNGFLEVVSVRIGASRVLVAAYGLSNCGLGKSGR
jgi:hypothetical protein